MGALNALDRAQFVASFGWIFEECPWVAERAWDARPFLNRESLHRAMVQQVEQASRQEQLALLRAHPDLGTRARVSETSASEQAGVGLDRLTPEEFDRLGALNTAYKTKFGFPFLYAVKGATKHDIMEALERRLSSSHQAEFAEALQQVYRIAAFRLEDGIGAIR